MTAANLLGFGHKQDDCAPSCFTQVNGYNYGIGIVRFGIVAAEPAPRRLQRDGGVPPLQEDRHRRGRDLRAGSIRLAGDLLEFQ